MKYLVRKTLDESATVEAGSAKEAIELAIEADDWKSSPTDYTAEVQLPGEEPAHKFPLGHVVMTSNLQRHSQEIHGEAGTAERLALAIKRHGAGDWGNLDPEDRAANERALREGERLMSVYEEEWGFTVWVITEWDRSMTTILLPEDY